ncbi:MAG TPA: hypothetical protein VIL36_08990 [Acidimicrobiales bacterium]
MLDQATERARALINELVTAEPAVAALARLAAQVEHEHGPQPDPDHLADLLTRADRARWDTWTDQARPAFHLLATLNDTIPTNTTEA